MTTLLYLQASKHKRITTAPITKTKREKKNQSNTSTRPKSNDIAHAAVPRSSYSKNSCKGEQWEVRKIGTADHLLLPNSLSFSFLSTIGAPTVQVSHGATYRRWPVTGEPVTETAYLHPPPVVLGDSRARTVTHRTPKKKKKIKRDTTPEKKPTTLLGKTRRKALVPFSR